MAAGADDIERVRRELASVSEAHAAAAEALRRSEVMRTDEAKVRAFLERDWVACQAKLEEQGAVVKELQTGNRWLEEQRQNLERAVGELQAGNRWLEEQRQSLERAVEELRSGNRWLEEQRTRLEGMVAELQAGNRWLEDQRRAWERTAEERGASAQSLSRELQELRSRCSELEKRLGAVGR